MTSIRGKKLSDFPELIQELNFNVHINLDTESIQAGSNKKLSWICQLCNKTYQRCPNQRVSGSACNERDCILKKRSKTNSERYGWKSHYDKEKKESIIRVIPEIINNDIEIRKDLPIDMQMSKYQVSSFGRIKNKHKNYIFHPKKRRDGYISSSFVLDDNTSKSYYYHVLIAKAFIDNPEKKPTVNHINKIKDDNKVSNLEWATYSEQNLKENKNPYTSSGKPIEQYDLKNNFIKRWEKAIDVERELGINRKYISSFLNGKGKQAGGFIWKYCETVKLLPGEIWKKVPLGNDFIETFASNLGRINSKENIPYGNITESGYCDIKIYNLIKKKFISFRVHRLVYMAFIENEENKPFVNHKSLDRSNNDLSNLEWVTHTENVNHQLDLNNRERDNVNSKAVQIDLETKSIIAEFKSVSHASKMTGFNNSGINWCCNGFRNTTSCGGFSWKFKENYNKDDVVIQLRTRKILQIDLKSNNVIAEFKSQTEASKITKIIQSRIGICCRKLSKHAGGFYWKYKDE
jgi:hypothetical protein